MGMVPPTPPAGCPESEGPGMSVSHGSLRRAESGRDQQWWVPFPPKRMGWGILNLAAVACVLVLVLLWVI